MTIHCHHFEPFVLEAKNAVVNVEHVSDTEIVLNVEHKNNAYRVRITPNSLECECKTFEALRKGKYDGRKVILDDFPTLCIHLEAAMQHAKEAGLLPSTPALSLHHHEAEELTPFQKNLRKALNEYTQKWVDRLASAYKKQGGSYIPLLVGPSDMGKTYIMAQVAGELGRRLVSISGMPSFSDDIAVGLDTRAVKRRGPIAEAFERARDGENVLLAIDEVRRFPRTVQDMLVAGIQVIPAHHAQTAGLPVNEPVRMLQSPLYGLLWAPVSKLYIIMGTNPWGTPFDPAFLRRVYPVHIEWDKNVIKSFGLSEPISTFVEHTHGMTKETEFGMPIGISVLLQMRTPDDTEPIRTYMQRLRLLDPIVYDALSGISLTMGIKP